MPKYCRKSNIFLSARRKKRQLPAYRKNVLKKPSALRTGFHREDGDKPITDCSLPSESVIFSGPTDASLLENDESTRRPTASQPSVGVISGIGDVDSVGLANCDGRAENIRLTNSYGHTDNVGFAVKNGHASNVGDSDSFGLANGDGCADSIRLSEDIKSVDGIGLANSFGHAGNDGGADDVGLSYSNGHTDNVGGAVDIEPVDSYEHADNVGGADGFGLANNNGHADNIRDADGIGLADVENIYNVKEIFKEVIEDVKFKEDPADNCEPFEMVFISVKKEIEDEYQEDGGNCDNTNPWAEVTQVESETTSENKVLVKNEISREDDSEASLQLLQRPIATSWIPALPEEAVHNLLQSANVAFTDDDDIEVLSQRAHELVKRNVVTFVKQSRTSSDAGRCSVIIASPKAPVWTQENMNLALIALRNRTLSLSKAATMYGIPSTTLWQRAQRSGISTPKSCRIKSWSEENLNSALEALRAGTTSVNKASKIYGIPNSTLYKTVRKQGIPVSLPFNIAPTSWTHDDLERALSAIREGEMTVSKASVEYGIPTGTLYGRCKRKGIELIMRSYIPAWSEQDMEMAIEAVHGGMSINMASERHGMPYSSLYTRLKRSKVVTDTSPSSLSLDEPAGNSTCIEENVKHDESSITRLYPCNSVT